MEDRRGVGMNGIDESGVGHLANTRTMRPDGVSTRRPGSMSFCVGKEPNARDFNFTKARVLVGRSPRADIQVDALGVSAEHCEILLSPDGLIELRDLGSKNGVRLGRVNGRKVLRAELHPGDILWLGEYPVELVSVGEVDVKASVQEHFGDLIGASLVMRELFAKLQSIAPRETTVLVTGETGTGKELAARALHEHSGRRGPFLTIDCTGLQVTTAEAALFGARKGAYTGATADRAGFFEAAHGGTLFVDEIGELPLELQMKFLRFLERGEFTRMGETHVRTSNARIIAATHRDLREEIEKGNFRQDLFYRLAQDTVEMPALRHRPEDVPRLAQQFLREIEPGKELAQDALEFLMAQHWAGNVRELKYTMVRASRAEGMIRAEDIELLERRALDRGPLESYKALHEAVDLEYFPQLLVKYNNNITQIAKAIKVSRRKLRDRLKELGLYVEPGERNSQ